MSEIRFSSKEHEKFFYTMMAKSRVKDCIRPEGLHEGWQTGGTVRLTRLAFNLWNGYAEQGDERMSTPYEIFDCGYAPYFYEAIKMRYPEYCRDLPAVKTRADSAERGGR